jgi:Fic family protein
MRAYKKTHPWLTFNIDFGRAEANLWILLGECQSKCEHIAGVPLRPDTAAILHNLYQAKGVLGTTAIEGNTLSEDQVIEYLQGTLDLPESREYLKQEISNVVEACNELFEEGLDHGGKRPLDVDDLKHMNWQVLRGLSVSEGVEPGKIRTFSVGVFHYRGAPHADCEYLLEQLCEWLNGDTFSTTDSSTRIVYAIIKSVLAHLYIAWIHPFGDGNGRTARLLEFRLLIESGVPTPAAHLLSNHYNLTRTEYYRQLDIASRSGGSILPFVTYAVQGLADGLREQIDYIRVQQFDVTWRNYVHEIFKDSKGVGSERRRHLVLDLSWETEPIPAKDLPNLSARVATAYASRTPITLNRDIRELLRMELIRRVEGGYEANKDRITAFLPRAMVAD